MADTIKIGNLDISAFKVGSSDCKIYLGDTLLYPQTLSYKLISQYSDTTEYKVECNISTSLTQTEVTSHTTPVTSMTSAVVSDCVNRIDDNAFSGATNLNSVTLSEGITKIGNQAFRDTPNLRSITFPSTLDTIEATAFRLSGLRNVSGIPSGVTYLGSGAFADCTSLSAATIPSSVTGSSTNLFLRDTALKEVHFERETAPELGTDAFNGCTALIKIYIPDCDCYNSYAAQSQFSGYTDLIYGEDGTKCHTSYNYKLYRKLKNGVTNTTACNSTSALTSGDVRSTYSMSVLTSTTSGLTDVIVGDCINRVSANTFYGMTQLSSITFSDKVTTLAASACVITNTSSENKLRKVVFGNGLKTIGKKAFQSFGMGYSSNTQKLTIPKSVTSIGQDAFLNSRIGGITFENGGRCDVGYRAFAQCISWTSINTNSIRRLESYAFYKLTGLTSVTLTNLSGCTSSVSNGHQFNACENLKDITIVGTGNLEIPTYFVSSSSLTAVTLGGVSSISNQYGLGGCDTGASRRVLTMLDTTPPTIGTTSISSFYPTVIYVPASAVNTYKSASNWSNYSSIIQAAPTE